MCSLKRNEKKPLKKAVGNSFMVMSSASLFTLNCSLSSLALVYFIGSLPLYGLVSNLLDSHLCVYRSVDWFPQSYTQRRYPDGNTLHLCSSRLCGWLQLSKNLQLLQGQAAQDGDLGGRSALPWYCGSHYGPDEHLLDGGGFNSVHSLLYFVLCGY